jgi:hypothetical protein
MGQTTKRNALIQKIKKGIVNVGSDVLSYPARAKAKRVMRQANYDVRVLKADRERGGNMPYPADESNPQFRTMVQANEVRDRLKRNY